MIYYYVARLTTTTTLKFCAASTVFVHSFSSCLLLYIHVSSTVSFVHDYKNSPPPQPPQQAPQCNLWTSRAAIIIIIILQLVAVPLTTATTATSTTTVIRSTKSLILKLAAIQNIIYKIE